LAADTRSDALNRRSSAARRAQCVIVRRIVATSPLACPLLAMRRIQRRVEEWVK